MRLMKWKSFFHGEVLAGLFLAGLGSFILRDALNLDYTSDVGPGPGFLPLWIGVIITCLSLLLIFVTLRKRLGRQIIRPENSMKPIRSLAGWFAMVLGVGLLTFLGFYVSFAMLTAFLVLTMEKRSVSTAVAVAVGSALGFYLIFSLALHVPLPSGPWGF